MRDANQEMFNLRVPLSYDPKKKAYVYRSKHLNQLDELIAELYSDRMGGVGTTYYVGDSTLEFTLSEEDNETTLFSIDGAEWKEFMLMSDVPYKFHLFVTIEAFLCTIAILKGDV